MMKVYGITNCDSVKKARAWLDERGIAYEFVDFKKTPPTRPQVTAWCQACGAQSVLNRRGTTWRKLDPAAQYAADALPGTISLLLEHPSAIRRPVVEVDGEVIIGFDDITWEVRFG